MFSVVVFLDFIGIIKKWYGSEEGEQIFKSSQCSLTVKITFWKYSLMVFIEYHGIIRWGVGRASKFSLTSSV